MLCKHTFACSEKESGIFLNEYKDDNALNWIMNFVAILLD